ncbi:MAG: type II secretory pathway component PulF [Rhodothermales bacterium]
MQLISAFADHMAPASLSPELAETMHAALAAKESLADSLKTYAQCIGNTNLEIIAVGETLGYLEPALNEVMRGRSADHDFHRAIRKEALYLLGAACLVAAILLAGLFYVVPKFSTIFDEILQADQLPWGTELLLSASHFVRHDWYWLMAISGVMGMCVNWLRTFQNCLRLHRPLCCLGWYRRRSQSRFAYPWASAIGAFVDAGLSRQEACELTVRHCPDIATFANAILEQDGSDAGKLLRDPSEQHDARQAETAHKALQYIQSALAVLLTILVAGAVLALFQPLIFTPGNIGG